ncbi:hypothetical protein Sjap_016822 [Stephania japonica]|uniref:Uncharacterized protein n=1 Tax=Stephania japonica TaxID=461633 RepID=A0AAP0I502_9MAGN
MGNCNTAESTAVSTVKLVLQDGKLEEFTSPVKVSHVLQNINSTSNNSNSNNKENECFICNADNIDFNNIVRAVNIEEELQPGQLYFALPLRRLRCPIQAEEMAALAVKASEALRKCRVSNGGGGYGEMIIKSTSGGVVASNARRREVVPVGFSSDGGGAPGRRRRKSGGEGMSLYRSWVQLRSRWW